MSAAVDPLISFVHVRQAAPPRWECYRIEDYEAGEQSPDGVFQGDQDVMWAVLEKDGKPAVGVRARYGFPSYDKPDDTDWRPTDAAGRCNFNIGRWGWDKALGRGVYWIQPMPQYGAADVVEFMGMDPDHHHRDFVCYYRWNDGNPPPPPAPNDWRTVFEDDVAGIRLQVKP